MGALQSDFNLSSLSYRLLKKMNYLGLPLKF